MSTLRRLVVIAVAASAVACAHGPRRGARPLSSSAQRFAAEAAAISTVAYEEDFMEARLVFHALPLGSRQRAALRGKLLEYILRPIATLPVEAVRKDPAYLGSEDDLERVFESFRDALELYAPPELWNADGLPFSSAERALVTDAANVVVALYSPRGQESAVATALYVVSALHPEDEPTRERLKQLFAWLDTGARLAPGMSAPRGVTTPAEVLEAVAAVWPIRPVVDRLAQSGIARQEQLATALRRPLGTGNARSVLSELLLDGEAMQALAVNVAALYLRCGAIDRAREAVARMEGKPGDELELRRLLANASRSNATAADYMALARRYLPRNKLLGGTSGDRLDAVVAAEVLRRGLDHHPAHAESLVLASRVARLSQQPFLALRYIEEAETLLEGGANAELAAEVAAERLDLSFARLRVHIDPDRIEPAAREAERLRQQIADYRRRFGRRGADLSATDIDYEIGRGFVDAGLIDRAQPFLVRAREGDPAGEASLQMANVVLKQGEPARAAQLLKQALEAQQQNAPAEETIGFVEMRSKLARALGNAYEAAGQVEEARKAWSVAVAGWERLRLEHLGRKNPAAGAEATFETGRLQYLLGRRSDGIQKFGESIEQNEARGESYIDAVAFLVQQGEAEAAQEIYRRALARSERNVPEYVKIYSSLWVLDISRRSGKPDHAAEAYLRSLVTRKVHLRPRRASAWYLPLARYAIGQLSYAQLAALADTPGKRAEVYFYEAMRRLADGRSNDAHDLWNKVLETKMFSFFEFEMAARYLRTGAPAHPRPAAGTSETTI